MRIFIMRPILRLVEVLKRIGPGQNRARCIISNRSESREDGKMIIQGSQKQMAEKANSLLREATLRLLRKKQNVVIAVPGGRSVVDIYKCFRDTILPWERINIFMLDERLVPADHPESNYRLVSEHLGSKISLDIIHQFIYNVDNPTQSVTDYNRELESCGGRFDIVLASSGEDGHIASLFPNHPSTRQDRNGFFLLYDSPKPPPGRMSASYGLIKQADTGIVLFFGRSKGNALRNFFDRQLSYKECPARIMTELPHYYLLTDQEVETT